VNNLELFQAYADAFEVAYESMEWQEVKTFFDEDAVYEIVANPPMAAKFVGRDSVMDEFVRVLDEFDYRFDTRSPVLVEDSKEVGDSVTNTFVLTYAKQGLPDIVMHGSETATYKDGKIIRLENRFTDETAANMFKWMGRNQSKLPPPRSQQIRDDKGPTLTLDENQSESYWMPNTSEGYATIMLSPESSPCNAYSVGTHVIPGGGALPKRCFARGDFVIYVDGGTTKIVLDGTEEILEQGDTVVVSRQVTHSIINNSADNELRILWFCIPSGYESLIRSFGKKKTGSERPIFDAPSGSSTAKDYYQGVKEIGALVPLKGQSLVIREVDRKSFWQSVPAQGYADMIISPHNYTSNSFAIGAQVLLPGASIPVHCHRRNEELLYVTGGSGYLVTDEGNIPIRPGNAVFVGRFARHGFLADKDNTLEVVWIFSPPELETVLAGMGTLRTPGEDAPAPFIPPSNIMHILKHGGFATM